MKNIFKIFGILVLFTLVACEGAEYTPNEENKPVEESPIGTIIAEQTTKTVIDYLFQKGEEYLTGNQCNTNDSCEKSLSEKYLVPENSEVKYISNYDGDTLKLEIVSDTGNSTIIDVRLLLLDSTEIQGEDGEPDYLAIEAKKEVEHLLKKANKIHIEYDKGDTHDKYGRHLMHVFIDGESLQKHLLSKGLAKIKYVFKPNITYLNEYEAAEQYARDHKIGLWSE